MSLHDSLLGEKTPYPDSYSPNLLQPVLRVEARTELGITSELPFSGMDIWTAYEVSWLDSQGKPQVRIGEITIACDSKNLVESKSLKLYFNSLNNECYLDEQAVLDIIVRDIQNCVQGDVQFSMYAIDEYIKEQYVFPGICIDNLDVRCDSLVPDVRLLHTEGEKVTEQLYSHLLKTNCPVTGQPDWASVWISYRGNKVERAGLLKYLVSYRQHQGFHENCVEQIFCDISKQCKPEMLQVYARYTRRGGLDINPYRYFGCEPRVPELRLMRQ